MAQQTHAPTAAALMPESRARAECEFAVEAATESMADAAGIGADWRTRAGPAANFPSLGLLAQRAGQAVAGDKARAQRGAAGRRVQSSARLRIDSERIWSWPGRSPGLPAPVLTEVKHALAKGDTWR